MNADSIHKWTYSIKMNADGVQMTMDGVQTPTDGVQTPTDGVQTPIDGVRMTMDGVRKARRSEGGSNYELEITNYGWNEGN